MSSNSFGAGVYLAKAPKANKDDVKALYLGGTVADQQSAKKPRRLMGNGSGIFRDGRNYGDVLLGAAPKKDGK